jgi:DNA-binding MarR family transcriptional regulator
MDEQSRSRQEFQELTFRVFRTAQRIIRAERRLGDARDSLRIPKLTALDTLAAASPSLEVEQLAAREGVTEPAMSNTLALLAERKLVVGYRVRSDRRRRNVHLTEDGLRQLGQEKLRLAALLAGIQPAEEAVIRSAVQILEERLTALYDQLDSRRSEARQRLSQPPRGE